ncbi:hypothetical protein [Corynebacterium kalidii]|uniref:Restriction endonuclease subunit S n=1 Tax=Corynebacterium kalidii TaxID=2931982 RepID=A0A9X1WET8_9CORY|nr:hypothetical protein [Corynebacterium kalidii]MCJ7857679.1 hypothetical protein [Corynebacterium kalidii]
MTNVNFGQIVEKVIGGGWGEEHPSSGLTPVRVLRGADFPAAQHKNIGKLPCRYEKEKVVDSRTLRAGDIVLEISGGTKDRPTGRTVLISADMVSKSNIDLIPASFCRLIRPDHNFVDSRWLYYHLQNWWNQGGSWEYQNQSTGISNFQYKLFSETYTFRLPSFHTQESVANVLAPLDDKIAANTQAIEVGRELLRSRWNRLSKDASTVFDLQDIVDINPKLPTVKEPTAPYLDMKNLPERGLLVTEWGERDPKGGARFQNGDTLLARITPCFENGKAAWVDFLEEDEICYGSTEYIVLRARHEIPPVVPYLVGTSDRFREFASQRRTGTSGRQRVQAKELADYSVPLPDPERLKEFEEFSDALLRRLGAARNESRTLAAARDELLPLLMSGKITVRDAEKRVEKEV